MKRLSSIQIRDAGAEDARVIVKLVKALAETDGFDSPIDEAYVRYYLSQGRHFALLADVHGEIAGLLAYLMKADLYHAGDTCYITELVVLEPYRAHGIGSALLEALLRRLEGQGAVEVSVTTMPDNQGAIRFYKQHGLVDEAVFLERHFYPP